MAGTVVLPGYRQLKPFHQGALDRYCGLYAIINAVALAVYPVHPLPPRHARFLFDRGVQFLERRGRLETVSLEGMNERLWMHLRDHLLEQVTALYKPSPIAIPLFTKLRPKRLEDAIRAITGSLDQGAAVTMALWGAYDHWTVVAGYTPTNLLLFDSWGFRRVGIGSFALRHPHQDARHKLTWRSCTAFAMRGGLSPHGHLGKRNIQNAGHSDRS